MQSRPVSITVWGILTLIFGVWGLGSRLFSAVVILVTRGGDLPTMLRSLAHQPPSAASVVLRMGLGLACHALLLVAGAGL